MATAMLTRPIGTGGNSLPGNVTTNIPVTPAATVTVDQCLTATNVAVKWIYTLVDTITNNSLTGEILATHRNGANPTHNRTGIIGDTISHQANVTIASGNLRLQITNSEPNTLMVSVVRIQVLA
jgi:hypothetical protein